MKTRIALALLLAAGIQHAQADLIWSTDFSDVSGWVIVFNGLGGDAGVTTDGSLADFAVQLGNNEVAFVPSTGVFPFVPFDPGNSAEYSMSFTVEGLSGSVSYDIRLDEFDAANGYLGTVYGVVPQGTFTGTTNVSLGGFSYAPGTEKLMPKITVFTGLGDQTATFDDLHFDHVPEPATAVLLLAGIGWMWRRRML